MLRKLQAGQIQPVNAERVSASVRSRAVTADSVEAQGLKPRSLLSLNGPTKVAPDTKHESREP